MESREMVKLPIDHVPIIVSIWELIHTALIVPSIKVLYFRVWTLRSKVGCSIAIGCVSHVHVLHTGWSNWLLTGFVSQPYC